MGTAINFYQYVFDTQCAQAEAFEQVQAAIESGRKLVFYSWRLPQIQFLNNRITIEPFNATNADMFIEREAKFIRKLYKFGINFKYLKLIPDDVFTKIWINDPPQYLDQYENQLTTYYQAIDHSIIIARFSQQFSTFSDLYTQTYNEVRNSFRKSSSPYVDTQKFRGEIALRREMYGNKLSYRLATQLAIRAFAMFAAESAILSQMNANQSETWILLAGIRSVDTYKYEFWKRPLTRPTLPKLFVL